MSRRADRREPTEARRTYGYARVSGREQGASGTSLDAQRDELERYCKTRGLPSPRIFVEVESASAERIEKRVELRALLGTVQPGDTIIVSKVDRWSRDIVHAVQSVRELVRRGVGFVSVGESIDASTEQGDSVLGIMAWAADQERKRIKARTVGRRKELRDQGLYVEGLPPVGYQREGRKLAVVDADAAIVREVFERCIRGESIGRLCERLQEQHPARHGWDHKTVWHMLRNRVYLGEVQDAGGAWMPSHRAIIPSATWQRAQEALDSRRLGGRRGAVDSRTANWLLRGLATCQACGRKMGAAYGENGHVYYACAGRTRRHGGSCRTPYVPVLMADGKVADAAVARLDELRAALGRPAPAKPVKAEPAAQDFAARRERLTARRTRLVDLAADGTISREELRERLAKIDTDIGKLDVEASNLARAEAVRSPALRRELLAETEQLLVAWRRSKIDKRRAILQRLAKRIAIARAADPRIEWRELEDLEVNEL